MSTPAVCSALYILDSNFKNLLSRDWRGDTSPQLVERFVAAVQDAESESEQRPVIHDEDAKCTFVYVQHNNLYLLALTRNNANAAALLTFLHHLVKIFIHYFKVRRGRRRRRRRVRRRRSPSLPVPLRLLPVPPAPPPP